MKFSTLSDVHKSAPLKPVLSRFTPIRTLQHYFCRVHSSILFSRAVESETEGILGGVGVGRNF
jgi:hypothetical protein